MALLSPRREVGEFKKRYKWMALAVLATFFLFVGRAVELQVVEYAKWARNADDNVTRTLHLPATRGVVRDTASRVIADNRSSYRVFITPQMVDPQKGVRRIAELMELTDDEQETLRQKIAKVPESRRSHQIEMFSDITRDQVAALETHALELPGVDVIATPVRTYPYGALGAHAVGYVNEVSADDIKAKGNTYHAGDRIGRTGLEKAWEPYLRGTDGIHRVFVDARGRRQDRPEVDPDAHEMHRDPVPGHDVTLSLDMELMRAVETAFRGQPSGSAVVVETRTGRVRALYSKPAYDPNEMSGRLSADGFKALSDNAFRPLIDKTMFETYFPGSTFKVVTALAALQEGLVNPADRIDCPGYYEIGNRRFRCSHMHGEVDMHKAIVQSCNVYFWKIAEKVGIDKINEYARELGFGEPSGIGVNSEAAGFLASRKWYEENYGSRFLVGYTLNTAIGQGNTRVTLLQLALAYAALGNGGQLFVPELVERVSGPDGAVVQEFEPRVRRKLTIAPEHLQYVRDSLVGVVNDPSGTAFEARIEGGVRVAGKTGTAQVSYRRPKPGEDPRKSEYFNRDHAWFAGLAPADNPEIAFVVLVEHGGGGGKYAAPVAMQIVEQYLGGRAAPNTQGAVLSRTQEP
ncbi:MAG: penicillin-binding protein 2 [Polyangiales bacterium]